MKPECFGVMDKVFPMGPDGLRNTPEGCQKCPEKVACLRAALATPAGAEVNRGGVGPPTPANRMVKGLRRWSALKAARQRGGQ